MDSAPKTVNLTQLTIEQIKAMLYDEIKVLDISQRRVQILEGELTRRQQIEKPQTDKPQEV